MYLYFLPFRTTLCAFAGNINVCVSCITPSSANAVHLQESCTCISYLSTLCVFAGNINVCVSCITPSSANAVHLRESCTGIPYLSGQPYVRLLAISTSVLAVSLIVLLMLFIYKRRQSNISVISDAVRRAAYPLNTH